MEKDHLGAMGLKRSKPRRVVPLQAKRVLYVVQNESGTAEVFSRLCLLTRQGRFFTMDSCYLSFCDSYIVWADGEEFDPKRLDVNKLRGDMYTFIVADHLRWRLGED